MNSVYLAFLFVNSCRISTFGGRDLPTLRQLDNGRRRLPLCCSRRRRSPGGISCPRRGWRCIIRGPAASEEFRLRRLDSNPRTSSSSNSCVPRESSRPSGCKLPKAAAVKPALNWKDIAASIPIWKSLPKATSACPASNRDSHLTVDQP